MPINIIGKSTKNTDLQFWLRKTAEERIEAVEFLRSQFYALSENKTIPRFVPVLNIRDRK